MINQHPYSSITNVTTQTTTNRNIANADLVTQKRINVTAVLGGGILAFVGRKNILLLLVGIGLVVYGLKQPVASPIEVTNVV